MAKANRKSGIAPVVLRDIGRVQCRIFLDEEVREWIRASLLETKKQGYRWPTAATVYRGAYDTFGTKRIPQHENSIRSHLSRHETVWDEWEKDPGSVS